MCIRDRYRDNPPQKSALRRQRSVATAPTIVPSTKSKVKTYLSRWESVFRKICCALYRQYEEKSEEDFRRYAWSTGGEHRRFTVFCLGTVMTDVLIGPCTMRTLVNLRITFLLRRRPHVECERIACHPKTPCFQHIGYRAYITIYCTCVDHVHL